MNQQNRVSAFAPSSQRPAAPSRQPGFNAFPHKPPPGPGQGIAATLSGLTGGIPAPAVRALALGAGAPPPGLKSGPLVLRQPTSQQLAQALFMGNPVLGKSIT